MPESLPSLPPLPPGRIGLLTHSVNPRGGVVHTLELAQALHDAGHVVTVMAPALPGQRFFRPLRCAVSLVPVHGTPRALEALVGDRIEACVAHLTGLLARQHFDVLHAHDGIGGNALATLQARGLIPGFVRTVHHLDDFAHPQLAAWQLRGFREARRVLCVSRLWCDTLAREHGVAADEVPNGVDLARFSPHPGPDDAALLHGLGLAVAGPVVLAVGGIEARKNSVRLLQAFARLRQRLPGAQLVLAGGASLLDHGAHVAEFQACARALGLWDSAALRVTGPLADAVLPALMRRAALLALPSLCEGFGLVVLEALASGTPVLVSRQAPFTEYLAPHEATWADPLDVDALALGLWQGLQGGRREAAAATARRLGQRFSWPASAARHTRLYHDTLATPVAAAPRRTAPCTP